MAYKIIFNPDAEMEFLALDKAVKNRILIFIEKLEKRINPRQLGASLQGTLSGLWKYRIGDYRLICKIEDELLTILVVGVGHRKNVYE